jgi:colanic acid biosynthesis glycosyl transferase WcaI
MKATFRFALLSHNYHPEPTGIPAFNTAMAEWLVANQGWEVTVFTGIPHYPWWKVPAEYQVRDYRQGRGDEVIHGVSVRRVRHFVPTPPPTGLGRMRLDASWLLRTAWRILNDPHGHDVVMVVAPPFLSGFLGLLARWKWNCPVVYHVQDLQVDAARELGMLPRRLLPLLGWLERVQLRHVDLVTTISHGMLRRIKAKTRTRIPPELVPNWADCANMVPSTGTNGYRSEWGVGPDTIVVAYSGNLGRKQGLEHLISAFAHLRELANVLFVIAGEGAERAALEKMAADQKAPVRFLGLAPVERLSEFITAADIHCVPQLRAAAGLVMPSKLMNLLALARPVVVTADPGTDLAIAVTEGNCGLVVPPEDPPSLATALRTLIRDPLRCAQMGRNGREYAMRTFDISSILGLFSQRIRTLASVQGSIT